MREKRRTNIFQLCNRIRDISDEEFEAVAKQARKQCEYVHPLKMATATRMHLLGAHNLRVIGKLRELRDMLQKSVEDLAR